MSWIEGKVGATNPFDYAASVSDIGLVFELTKRLGLSEGKYGSLKNDEFAIVPKGKVSQTEGDIAVRFGCGCGYANFQVEFYFDENGKLVRHGVWE